MKTFTIEQIRKYIQSQDSLGDVLYNLSEDNIDKANNTKEEKSLLDCEYYYNCSCDCIDKCMLDID